MNRFEINEIKRRFKPEFSNFDRVYGCYVNSGKNIVSKFDSSLTLMEQEEKEMYLKLLKKTISGTLGKNLINIEFATQQVMNEEEHKLLMELKDTSLRFDDAREAMFKKIVDSVEFEDSDFLVLMAADTYDVPYKDKNDQVILDGNTQVFKYFICCVCPVKDAKLELKYDNENGEFHPFSSGHAVQSPALGFMFPTFDDRATNIYNVLYYTKNPNEMHQNFIDTIFHTNPVMSVVEQKSSFQNLLEDALDDECSFETITNINDEILKRIEVHKESKVPVPLEFSAKDMENILSECGVGEEKIKEFRDVYIDHFGAEKINPANLVNTKKYDVETDEVKITMSPDNSFMVKTKVIDGKKYILIPATGDVKINGISINIPDEE